MARVALVGCGATGSAVVSLLARAGVAVKVIGVPAGLVAMLIGDVGLEVIVRLVEVPTVSVMVPDTTLPFDDWAAA
jgi:3-hydroxyisobutyrate dehydrogenase-like beta-hydroxyacid dehydrogenase